MKELFFVFLEVLWTSFSVQKDLISIVISILLLLSDTPPFQILLIIIFVVYSPHPIINFLVSTFSINF